MARAHLKMGICKCSHCDVILLLKPMSDVTTGEKKNTILCVNFKTLGKKYSKESFSGVCNPFVKDE